MTPQPSRGTWAAAYVALFAPAIAVDFHTDRPLLRLAASAVGVLAGAAVMVLGRWDQTGR